jgi:hypothetical protein
MRETLWWYSTAAISHPDLTQNFRDEMSQGLSRSEMRDPRCHRVALGDSQEEVHFSLAAWASVFVRPLCY